jgi:thiol-disulfide isomerase/thioredoxin
MDKKAIQKFLVICAIVLFILNPQSRAEADEFFPNFSSQTLSGEPITDDIFSGKRLTMVNIWATWCGPCISEMPDLGRLARMMPEGTQLVGIVQDVLYNKDATGNAKEIVEYANADFPQILAVNSMITYLQNVYAIPTTIFVDSAGKIVGEPLIGSMYAESYLSAIENILGETSLDSYAITVSNNITGGIVTLNKASAAVGESVSFIYAPDRGYELESITAHRTGNTSVDVPLSCTDNVCVFVMPAYPVTIEASFKSTANASGYAISASSAITGGTVKLSKATAVAGESVTFTYTPNSGYQLVSISAHRTGDTSMNVPLSCKDYVCDFVMPAYPVTIEASFRTTNSNANDTGGSGGGGCDTTTGSLAVFALGALLLALKKRG